MRRGAIVDRSFCFEEETHLTVHKTSIFFPGDGFVVYDPKCQLILRSDFYGPDSRSNDELFLMDSSGECLLTLHRKKPSLHQRWEGFLGEKTGGGQPIFTISRSSIIGQSRVTVQVFGDVSEEYYIEGAFWRRSCRVYGTSSEGLSEEPVAEIKRKVDPDTNVLLGKDVFLLCIKAGIDGAFVMGLVLVLNQMFGDDDTTGNETDFTTKVVS